MLLGIVGFMFSCQDEDPVASQITSFQDYGFEGLPERIEVPETDSIHTWAFTFDDNQITDVSLDLHVIDGGDATDGADFALNTAHVDVAALGKAGEFSFAIAKDYLTEGNESFFIEIVSAEEHGLPLRHVMEVVIVDDIHDDELLLIFDWGVPFTFQGTDYNACQFVDMDVYLIDADSTDLGIYQAATGACPEQIIVAPGFGDGEYFMGSNIWDNSTLKDLELGIDYTMTVTAIKQTVFEATWSPADAWPSNATDQANDGNASYKVVGKFVVSGNTVQVFADDGTLLGEG